MTRMIQQAGGTAIHSPLSRSIKGITDRDYPEGLKRSATPQNEATALGRIRRAYSTIFSELAALGIPAHPLHINLDKRNECQAIMNAGSVVPIFDDD
jgi:hypothetical protein